MVEYQISLLVDSGVDEGALNVSADGSTFTINLETPITIPKEAKTCTVEVVQSTVWWVVPNITTGVNDNFTYDDGVAPAYNFQVEQGLYDLSSLELAIKSGIINAGGNPDDIDLIADNATQKVIMRLNRIGASVDFTIANSLRNLLGFNSAVIGPTVSNPQDFLGDSEAAFNQVEYFLVHSDITNTGIRTNNSYTQTIGQVLITVPPGSQVVSTPFNPIRVAIPELIGSSRKKIRFYLTTQNNELVNTGGETWSSLILIRYVI